MHPLGATGSALPAPGLSPDLQPPRQLPWMSAEPLKANRSTAALSCTPACLLHLLCSLSPSQFTSLSWCHWSKNKGSFLSPFYFYRFSNSPLGLVVSSPKHIRTWPQPPHQLPEWSGAPASTVCSAHRPPGAGRTFFSLPVVPSGCARINPDSSSWPVRSVPFDPPASLSSFPRTPLTQKAHLPPHPTCPFL